MISNNKGKSSSLKYSRQQDSVKTYSSISSKKSSSSEYKFTPTQVLINQILKVLKLRLIIENIRLPEERLIELIKSNLRLIDIRFFKISSLNVFVDDLVEILKQEIKTEKEEQKSQTASKQNHSNRTTILSFNRKDYDTSYSMNRLSNYKKSTSKKEPMKFSMTNKSAENNNVAFYLEGNNKNEITTLNDCDIEEMQDRIIDEVSKEYFKEKEDPEV